jgi:hypothetical protein
MKTARMPIRITIEHWQGFAAEPEGAGNAGPATNPASTLPRKRPARARSTKIADS